MLHITYTKGTVALIDEFPSFSKYSSDETHGHKEAHRAVHTLEYLQDRQHICLVLSHSLSLCVFLGYLNAFDLTFSFLANDG